ncbi:MAG: class C sortase [Bulleidia sp.]
MSRRQHRMQVLLSMLFLIIGSAVLMYPWIARTWNAHTQSQAIVEYRCTVDEADRKRIEMLWKQAEQFNAEVIDAHPGNVLNRDETAQYMKMLDISGNRIIGSIAIPAIDVELPVYRGTSEDVLKSGAGHVEWSSLPTGQNGNHTVISGHSGLPSASLFTHLNRLKEGDVFTLQVLNRTFTYRIISIAVSEPQEIASLVRRGQSDLCTLVTCTPYGINTHRLLVTGMRVETDDPARETGTAQQICDTEPIAAVVLIWIFVWLFILNHG